MKQANLLVLVNVDRGSTLLLTSILRGVAQKEKSSCRCCIGATGCVSTSKISSFMEKVMQVPGVLQHAS
ncbi:hypothetical protein GDO86_011625 [Hymenochirus boettgeri]|uniref:Uncharacterized protein n=1 Tax=Hymenochirus boettgeri TaxID=247094 RepID=A0A8T2JCC0_9PIPI|nr:hypothetical protein GDO86_011625 [Hymenochirus boettgeri]